MEGADSAIAHMNDDHTDTLADYVRHYGGYACVPGDAKLIALTNKSMTIEHEAATEPVVVPFDPPLAKHTELRKRLVQMAASARISRIPPYQHPPLPAIITIAIGLPLLGVVCYTPATTLRQLRPPLSYLTSFGTTFSDVLFFRSLAFKRVIFGASAIAHIAEGVYAARLITRAAGTRALRTTRGIAWVLLTTVYGFPSLKMLLRGLKRTKNS